MSWLKRRQFRNPKIYSVTPRNENDIDISPKLLRYIFLSFLIIILLWFLFFSRFFKIKTIEIEGSLNDEVKAEINQFYNQNILTFVLGNKEEWLAKKQTSIETLEIRRGLPSTLKIKVNVREPIIGWKTQEKTYLLDKNGVVFELEGANSVPVVEDTKNVAVSNGEQIVTPEFVTFTYDFVDRVKAQNMQITAMRIIETTFQIEADTDQGFRIIVSTITDLDNQLKALSKVLETKRSDIHEYVDLRIEGRVYYK